MKYILGKKLGMSQTFDEGGNVVPVTLIEAGPCVITQIRNETKDGYDAVQLGFGRKKNISKPLQGHFKKSGNFRWVREFRIKDRETETGGEDTRAGIKVGDAITARVFKEGDIVNVSGVSKGKGFQGVVKRHGFHGSPASHGTKHTLRAPGSIGSSFPEHVFKGMRMGGRMGGESVTVKNLKVVKVDSENNLIAIEGAVPGNRNTLVEIRSN